LIRGQENNPKMSTIMKFKTTAATSLDMPTQGLDAAGLGPQQPGRLGEHGPAGQQRRTERNGNGTGTERERNEDAARFNRLPCPSRQRYGSGRTNISTRPEPLPGTVINAVWNESPCGA
jgi:hypothetical protein